jgi:hypothetical protein
VAAFALVVTMDLSRRDNDRKVLAVKVQMQELMIVFFECGLSDFASRLQLAHWFTGSVMFETRKQEMMVPTSRTVSETSCFKWLQISNNVVLLVMLISRKASWVCFNPGICGSYG